jgi:hypothetical protein
MEFPTGNVGSVQSYRIKNMPFRITTGSRATPIYWLRSVALEWREFSGPTAVAGYNYANVLSAASITFTEPIMRYWQMEAEMMDT